jgi:hypothetical protein
VTRKRLYVSVVLLGVCALAGFGTVAAVRAAASFGSGSPRHVPAQFRETLAAGRWDFYELTGTTRGTSAGPLSYSVTHQRSPDLSSSLIAVTAPDGRPVPVHDQSGNTTETLQKGPDRYTGVANFEAPAPGRYSVTVRTDGPDQVILARPVLSDIAAVLPWGIGALAGALCVLLGLILLTLDYRRRPSGRAP